MKKILSLLMIITLLCTCLIQVSAADTLYIYVSPNGDDAANGTYAAPVATLSRAVELAGKGNAVINMMGGEYLVSKTAAIKDASNITIRTYNGESVVLNAANEIDNKLFKKVTDQNVLDRIVEKKARENVVAVSMEEAGITELGNVYMSGFAYPDVPQEPQLLVDGTRQILARYPDQDYLNIDEVVDAGFLVRNDPERRSVLEFKGQGIAIRTNDARLNKWKQAENLFMYGFFEHDWAHAVLECTIDFDKKNLISTEYPSVYGVSENRRFYFFNLLEELSSPGEWYLDRNTGILYLYPEEKLTDKNSIEFITFSDSFITVDDSDNITIDGIQMNKGLGSGIVVNKSKNVLISDCVFNDVSSISVSITESYDCEVTYCTFKNIGAGGVGLTNCGDRATLTPGNCSVNNCVLDNYSTLFSTGPTGISITGGVGNTVAHNYVKDGPNCAIYFDGNNHIIEYNDVENACYETADAGAIYAGRDWTGRGNEVRYNYVHDMNKIDTNTGMKVQAIYLDDGFSSANVHGNIIQRVPSVALFGGGRYNTFENNIILECKEPFVFDERYLTWDQTEIMNKLLATPYTSDVWKEAYPELQGILEDEPGAPKYNTIRNNISMDSPGYRLSNTMLQYALEVEDDYTVSKNDFVDYAKGNLNLKEDSEVFKKVPEFEAIDFDAIGVEERKTEEKDLEDILVNSVVLKLDVPKTYVFGNASTVDPNNSAVYPFTENDRTLVPVRFVAESFGGTVTWDETTQKVGIVSGEDTIELIIDQTEMKVNGKTVVLDVPAQVKNDRTMLPLRAVVEALGKTVFWDDRGLIVLSNAPVLENSDATLIEGLLEQF